MKCKTAEAQIALYVEQDLNEKKAAALEGHLERCAACREFLTEMRASQSLLKGLRANVLDEGSFAEVRRRVREGVKDQPPSRPSILWGWRLRWGATAALALAALLWLSPWPPPSESPQRVAEAVPPTPEPVLVKSPPRAERPQTVQAPIQRVRSVPVGGRGRVGRSSAKTSSAAVASLDLEALSRDLSTLDRPASLDGVAARHDSTLFKLATDDPQVVIIWLSSENGG